MKVGIESHAGWEGANTLYLLPSIHITWDSGIIDNLDENKKQRHFALWIHFDFLFLGSFTGIHLMWGNKGEITQEEWDEHEEREFRNFNW